MSQLLLQPYLSFKTASCPPFSAATHCVGDYILVPKPKGKCQESIFIV